MLSASASPSSSAAAHPGPVIGLRGLGVRLGSTPILRDVDLSVARGEAVGIHGANGSGKTTLLRVAATLLAPTDGEGEVLGRNLFAPERFAARPRIELIGHVPALYPWLTLEENTAFVARVTGVANGRVGAVLEMVGLGGARARRVDQCSHGMQRRAEFARVLLTAPDLLLLDEPHAGLDRTATDLVRTLTEAVTARGGAALLVSHDHERVAGLVDRAYELSDGRLHELDGPR